MRYTAEHPPVQVMLQAFMGVKVSNAPKQRPTRPAKAKDFDTAWREMEEQFKGVPDIWKN